MSLELQIIRPPDFIRLGTLGTIDFDSSKEALRQLAYACRKRGIFRSMLDLRDLPIPAKPIFTPSELTALINTFPDIGMTSWHRLALLYRVDPHHGVRMFAFIGTLKGWQMRSFIDFEEALTWLHGDECPTSPTAAEDAIPIQIVGTQAGK